MDRAALEAILAQAVADGVTPGAQAALSLDGRLVETVCVGRTALPDHAPPDAPPAPVTAETLYDLASLTKALVTAPLVWHALGQGILTPEAPAARWLAEWAPGRAAGVTVGQLLNHTSGLPAWRALHREARALCPDGDPAAIATQARGLLFESSLEAAPGQVSCYSDLGYMLLGLLLERALGGPLDALAEALIFAPLGMRSCRFVRLLDGARILDGVAATEPTEAAPGLACVSGQVHDENAFALGGVAGHAGLFGAAQDVARFGQALLAAEGGALAGWPISPSAVRWAMSTRAAGFDAAGRRLGSHLGGLDTPSGDATSAGPLMTADPVGATVGHLGFTGTSLWVDRSRRLSVALLTNRVHPSRDREEVRGLRVRLHTEVARACPPAPGWRLWPEVPEVSGVPTPRLAHGGRRELEVAIEAARRAGVLARARFAQAQEIVHKGEVDLVTQTDLDCEAIIIETIRAAFPDHGFLAEEGGRSNSASPCTWIIDPIDGTTNFSHRTPHFAICVALQVEDQLQIGVIYDPMRDELFAARKGGGAWLNGRRMQVSGCRRLNEALAATGFPYDRRTSDNNNVDYLGVMIRRVQGIRRMGSAGLDLAYVAAGRYDLYWELRIKPWDVAAGLVLIDEAGGRVTDIEGGPYDIHKGDVLASCGPVHGEAAACLTQVAEARRK